MTSLQKQLAAIAASSTHQLDLKAQKVAHGKSLLFEPRVAASQSFENVYFICYEGFRDLCSLDPRFVQFSRSLFSEQSKVEDRTQMTQKENDKLNGVLEAFMTMVGPRLLLKPAEKALEWLVRRFRVHEYNTECLVLTYLPYHNSPQFLALLSILPANPKPGLRFLHPYIQSPTNPPRRTIIYTAVNTPAFFNALQNYVVKVLEAGHQGSSLLSFWSTVTTQAIDGILDQSGSGRRGVQDQKTEDLLLRVFPVLNACMRSSNGSEAVLACYMIVIVLVTKATFEDKILNSLMEAAVISQNSETLDACLICLAILAEERSQVQLPPSVSKRLLRVSNMGQTLVSLSKRCRIDRLALGVALGALERIDGSEESQHGFREIIESRLLDEPQLSVAFSALLNVLQRCQRGSSEHNQLLDYASKLSDSPTVSHVLELVAKKSGTDLESLGLVLGSSLEEEATPQEDEDEDMLDADESQDSTPLVLPPEIREISFLDTNSSITFQKTLDVFELAVSSNRAGRFLSAEVLQRQVAFQTPLFLSFLVRTWCSQASMPTRVAALRSATSLIKSNHIPADLQNLVPYLLFALADPLPAIRRSAVACVAALSAKNSASQQKSDGTPWGSSKIYGINSTKVLKLSGEQMSGLLSIVVPMLEECAMDSSFVVTALKEAFEGTQSTKGSKNGLKTTLRGPIVSFLGSHVAITPLLTVRLRLLPVFGFLGKYSAPVRTNILLPAIGVWCFLSVTETANTCVKEHIALADAERAHIAALVPRESASVNLLNDVVSGNFNKERTHLLDAAFDWLAAHWVSIRSDSRQTLSQCLLGLALQENHTAFDDQCRGRSLETLRSIKLDTATLVSLLESVPSSVHMPEGPPAKKRRRTSRNEMARADFQSPDDVARLLRRLTLVLEIIEGSNPGDHPALFKNLFTILGELQQLKQQSGSDLVYLQSLILGSLTPIVNRIKAEKDTAEYQASVRADLLIDCIRHSTSPQVQNAALLLIATLASWVPELILHNLMPIFTFIGSTLLRQQDDYSAHVVDQTISRVVPPLAASLRAKHKHFLTGVADLLLSFTAAFEHIPQHRRLKLFSELARTLGPEDSLSAIIALLVDRYPQNKVQHRFVIDLLAAFDPIATLQAFKGYLDLVEDAAGSKGKLSDTLFSLSEKQPNQVEAVLNNLLSSLAGFAADDLLRPHAGRSFSKAFEPTQPRALFASIVETIIRVSKKVAKQQKMYQSCARVLGKCLDLLPTIDLVKSAELLLTNPDDEVKIAAIRSVEVRAKTVTQNKRPSVEALVAFLPSLDETLQWSEDLDAKRVVLGCIESIVARFGKKDTSAVATVAQTVAGAQSLSNGDNGVRILSLLCLTSVIDVLEDDAISLLPEVLPKAFDYLGAAIEDENTALHNAVYALLSNTVQRLGFMFSRDYLVPVLKLSQQSAVGALDVECDETRKQFYQIVSQHLEAQEVFTTIKSTWPDAIEQGFEATEEQLALILSTVESQTKAKLVKTSSTLFSLLLSVFKLRDATKGLTEEFDDRTVAQLEGTLVKATLSMTLKLNDATFRPFFAQLVDLAAMTSVTFYKFLTAFFDKFKSIVTSYSSYIIEHASRLLESLAKHKGESELRTALLAALQKSFEHDQDGFWQAPSHFSAIMPPLFAQLTIPISPSTSATPPAISAIVELAAACPSSTDTHREMNNILLRYMRAEEAHTRLATVMCERELTKKLGEEWLGLLPEMLPFIGELRDDDDEGVERETQRWKGDMERILGEDLDGMLS
ncbi:hypothetical protein K458DRAFT_377975 [Lentithecium fluviatile CBS 122367]|uniref:U3 small nucleolar RNA-associated protein 10 n=1 Tax=Lentithecium fluviatile CBS 122367 TaxID=1168545 RepID=A0A6G1II49_9PLEO|nr:hypothetical protein K458DRAFT_377975 [Lentithecium fluviatile CBS 122367]